MPDEPDSRDSLDMPLVGKAIRREMARVRDAGDISKLARKAGVSRHTVHRVVTEGRRPSANMLARIGAALDLEPDVLLAIGMHDEAVLRAEAPAHLVDWYVRQTADFDPQQSRPAASSG